MANSRKSLAMAGKLLAVLTLSASFGVLAVSQTSEDAAAEQYAALLQQIADAKTNIAHTEVFIGTQQAEMESLKKQIGEVQGVIDSVEPMIEKMRVAISEQIESDIPFNAEERFNRLGALDEIVQDKEARAADKWRRALGIYEAEVAYGQSVVAYSGSHPIEEQVGGRYAACEQDINSAKCALSKDQKKRLEDGAAIETMQAELKDGYYLRYGRLALAYQSADAADVYLYNPGTKAWDLLTGGRAIDVRRAVKMARGEAAPTVIEAPILIQN